jgi:glutamate decarboxylase
MSEKYRHLLKGIKLADSVTIDGHKQFYMPMGCGMVVFKDPSIMDAIAYHANYVNRPGSVDLGIKSLAGSREASSIILDSALKIMGSRGYALLIEHGIDTCFRFAEEIEKRPDFQLITRPELNILTYRICPFHIQRRLAEGNPEQICNINKKLNKINRDVQRLQREAGKSFVSRTKLKINQHGLRLIGTKAQRHKGTEAQRHRGTEAQRHRGTNLGNPLEILYISATKVIDFCQTSRSLNVFIFSLCLCAFVPLCLPE